MKEKVRAVAMAFVIAVALALPVGVVAYQGSLISDEACRALNQYRAEDLAKWEFIIKLSPPPKEGTLERDRLDRFTKFLQTSDSPKAC